MNDKRIFEHLDLLNPRRHPSLPQNDSIGEQMRREEQLAEAQKEYVWSKTIPNLEGVPMSSRVPREDRPSLEWFVKAAVVAGEVLVNVIGDHIEPDSVGEFKKVKGLFDGIKSAGKDEADGLLSELASFHKTDDDDEVAGKGKIEQNPENVGVIYAAPGAGGPEYWRWRMARTFTQVADMNYHELFVHLARTHLLMEAVAVATRRELAENHPLNILLVPHCEGTLFINNAAASTLVAPGSPIDQVFGSNISFIQAAAGKDRLDYDFYENMLPRDLAARGVDNPEHLPEYPYRDDGLLVWNVIHRWAADYVDLYYASDGEVTGDTELSKWAAALMGEGMVKGFKPITSRSQLKDVLTMIMFTAGPQHAAVNFPQSSLMTYVPAMDAAVWGDARPDEDASEEGWLSTLSPLDGARTQLGLLHVLGGVYYRPLGDYRSNDFPYGDWFRDSRITDDGGPLDAFRKALGEIDERIDERNRSREPYNFLKPSQIPTSINI